MEEWTLISSGGTDWLTYVFTFNFLLFVFCKWRYQQQFFSFFRVIDTPLYFNSYGDRPIHQQGFMVLSIVFSLINLSLITGFYLAEYQSIAFDFRLFISLLLGISGIVVLRQIAVMIAGYFFQILPFIQQYQFRITTYFFRLNILIFVGLILYQYTFSFSSIFYASFALVTLLLYLLYHLLVIKQLFSTINQGGLYFILYLCTLKLSPWILLINGLKLSL
ncbi:MAG: DUF4271 domain-containing protein [Flavobacteriaceae bacterium]